MLLTLTMLTTAFAAEAPEVGVVIEPMIAVDTQSSEDADVWETWTWVRAHAKQRLDNSRWFIAVNADHNIRSGEDLEGIWTMSVGESGWAGKVGPTHLRAGVLIERWGKLDMLSSIDVLNPRDFRAGALSTIEAARVPIPMATWQAGSNSVRAEISYAPFPQGDRIQMIGSDWSLIKPGMMENYVNGISDWEGDTTGLLSEPLDNLSRALYQLDPSSKRALGSAAFESGRPEDFGTQGNIGARLELEAQGIDAAFMGANLRSSIPRTRLGPSYRDILQSKTLPGLDKINALSAESPLETSWPRTWMAGTELSTVLGPIGVRAEGAWWSNTVVQQTWLDSTTSPTVSSGLGLDYAHGSTIFIALEGRWSHLLEPVQRPLMSAEHVVEVGTTARLSLAGDRIQVLAAAIANLTFEEWLARPEIRWVTSDSLSLGLGAVLLYSDTGPPETLGEALSYTGGPISMTSDNDAVFFTMRWSL